MMIARRRLTMVRALSTGVLLMAIFLVILLSKKYALNILVAQPAHLFNRFYYRPKLSSVSIKGQIKPKNVKSSPCDLYHLTQERQSHQKETVSAQCQRVPPVPGSCDVAEKLFHSRPPGSCDNQTAVEFCKATVTNQKFHVTCSDKHCGLTLFAATIDHHNGHLIWHSFHSTESVEKWIIDMLKPSADRKHFGFCYIACGDKWTDMDGNQFFEAKDGDIDAPFEAIQLLLLPPLVPSKQVTDSSLPKQDININIIFVDSVSRQHFFRSLPNTVQFLRRVAHSPSSNLTVLDFELVQSIRSRTFETLQVLFSGEIDPSVKPFGVLELPPEPLKTEALLKGLKQRGYSTLWLEDLCYQWEWGLSKDLRVLNKSLTTEQRWKKLQHALLHAGIDSLEMTYAMCKILSENGVPDHFHGPDAVCLNGRHQHEYLLDYLWLYQRNFATASVPFFTLLETNVGHEDTGRRIQAFDKPLHHYLELVSTQKNTLTIIMSDHGNSYGAFLENSMEGRMELFHPHLIMIVPDKVAAILGHSAMEALRINQFRLVSHLDLHYMLKSVVDNFQNKVSLKHSTYNISRQGLLSVISTERSCNHIPRIMPNLCICQNFDMAVDGDAYHALFAHLAVGKINNEIQHQFHSQNGGFKSSHGLGFGHCRRLRLAAFNKIRKSFRGGAISLKMDLLIPSRDTIVDSALEFEDYETSTQQQMEIFFVAIDVQLNGTKASAGSILLETVDRITPYSKFSVCADSTVKVQLCICELNDTHKTEMDSPDIGENDELYLTSEIFTAKGSQDCLVVILKKNDHGGVFSVANVCSGNVFHVVFDLQTSEMIVSDAMPRQEQVFPGQELFLCMAVKNAPKAQWGWSFTLHHQQHSLS